VFEVWTDISTVAAAALKFLLAVVGPAWHLTYGQSSWILFAGGIGAINARMTLAPGLTTTISHRAVRPLEHRLGSVASMTLGFGTPLIVLK
jgi:hypothetical protein